MLKCICAKAALLHSLTLKSVHECRPLGRRFMRSHTREHQSILDPTGRLPVPPSEATLVKRWDFGMATTATDELVAQYRQLHPEVEAAGVLLPRKLR